MTVLKKLNGVKKDMVALKVYTFFFWFLPIVTIRTTAKLAEASLKYRK